MVHASYIENIWEETMKNLFLAMLILSSLTVTAASEKKETDCKNITSINPVDLGGNGTPAIQTEGGKKSTREL